MGFQLYGQQYEMELIIDDNIRKGKTMNKKQGSGRSVQ
jgi:hypothetical protein